MHIRCYGGICYGDKEVIVFDESTALVYEGYYMETESIRKFIDAPVVRLFVETFKEVPKVEWNGEVYKLQGTGVPVDSVRIVDGYLVQFGNRKPSIVFGDVGERYEWNQETGELYWVQLYRECEACAPEETRKKFLGKVSISIEPGFINELKEIARKLSRPNNERAVNAGLPYDPLFKNGEIITGFKRIDLNNYRDDFIGTRKAKRYFMVPYREGLYTVVIPDGISGNILTADSINDIPDDVRKDIKLFRIYQWDEEPTFVFVKPIPRKRVTKVYIFTEKSFREAKEPRKCFGCSERIMPARVLTFRGRTVIEDIETRVSAFLEVYSTHAPQYTEHRYIDSVYD